MPGFDATTIIRARKLRAETQALRHQTRVLIRCIHGSNRVIRGIPAPMTYGVGLRSDRAQLARSLLGLPCGGGRQEVAVVMSKDSAVVLWTATPLRGAKAAVWLRRLHS